MLGASKANTFRTKVPRSQRIFRGVSIRPNSQASRAICVTQQAIN